MSYRTGTNRLPLTTKYYPEEQSVLICIKSGSRLQVKGVTRNFCFGPPVFAAATGDSIREHSACRAAHVSSFSFDSTVFRRHFNRYGDKMYICKIETLDGIVPANLNTNMKYRRIFSTFLLTAATLLGFSVASPAQEITKTLNRTDAIARAQEEGKLILVQMGRPNCSDCRGVSNHLARVSPPIKQTTMAGYVYWYINIDKSNEEDPYVAGMGQYALPVMAFVDPNNPDKMLQRVNGSLSPSTLLINVKNQMKKLPIYLLNLPEDPLTDAIFEVVGATSRSSLAVGTGANAISGAMAAEQWSWEPAFSTDNWENWSANIVLQPGTNYFYCYANAGAANSWTNRTMFVYNGVAVAVRPSINVDPQPLPTATLGGQAAFSVNASGTPPMHYQWQKDTLDLANSARISGSQSSAVAITSLENADSGDYRVIVSNTYGSVTSRVANLTFFTDTVAPAVSVTSHQNHQDITGAAVTLQGNVSDASPSSGLRSVTANGMPATINGGAWSMTLTGLVIGENQVEVIALDNSGNTKSMLLSLNRLPKDETGPVLNLTSHQTGQTVTGNITLAGTVQDGGSGVAWVKVNGAKAAGGVATEGNLANWSTALRLKRGTNPLTITTADLLGNTSSVQISIELDTTRPVVRVQTPARNAQIGQEFVAFSGTASDNIVAVYRQLNDAAWVTANGTGSWTDAGFANPGPNVLRTYAVDTAGRTSAVVVVSFTYNRMAGYKGTFNGLFQPTNSTVTASNSGFFSLLLSDKGSFSGKLLMGTTSMPFSGNFNQETMESEVTVKRRAPLSALTLKVKVNPESENPENGGMDTNVITGVVIEPEGWSSDIRAYRGVTKAAAATYTMLIEGCNYWGNCYGANTNQPDGDSPASVKITTRGLGQLSGKLADGSSIRQSATVSEAGYWPVYVSLYRGTGVLIGWLNNLWTTNVVNDERSGMLNWVQPAGTAGSHYVEGFSQPRVTRLTTYHPPLLRQNPVNWSEADVVITGGNIPYEQPLTNHVVLNNGLFSVAAGDIQRLSLKVTPTTGLFSGTFINPISGRSTKISGALVDQEDPMAQATTGGWWLGPDKESGNIRLYPTE